MRLNRRSLKRLRRVCSSDMVFNILSLVPGAREKIIELNGRMAFGEKEK